MLVRDKNKRFRRHIWKRFSIVHTIGLTNSKIWAHIHHKSTIPIFRYEDRPEIGNHLRLLQLEIYSHVSGSISLNTETYEPYQMLDIH